IMLLGKNGCRDEESDLLTVRDRLEGSTDCHFRLPVSDIPAKKTIHWTLPLHVLFHFRDGTELVFRLVIWKCIFERSLQIIISGERVPFFRLTLRIEFDQIIRDVFY